MSDTGTLVAVPKRNYSPIQSVSEQSRWREYLKSPLWIILLIAGLVRVWLILHTHGTMDGGEATVGIQAENILRGGHPLFYYGAAFMGSFEAYFCGFIFLFT